MLLLVPAHPGSPGQRAVKRLLLLLLIRPSKKYLIVAKKLMVAKCYQHVSNIKRGHIL